MKRIILIILSALLVSAITFGGCGGPAEEAPTTPTTPTTPEVKPIEWTFVSFMPPFDVFAVVTDEWGKQLEEATEGRMKVTFYWAESLVKIGGLFDAVVAGTADMALHPLAFHPERLSLAWVSSLPGIYQSPRQTGKTMLALFDKYEEMRGQFLPTRIAWIANPGPFELASKKPVKTMEDLKGLKISSGVKYEILSWEALGATPVPVHLTEAYQALETGVIEASCLDFHGIYSYRLHEVTQYRTGNTQGIMNFLAAVMNSDSYNELPPDIQQKFNEVTDPLTCTNTINEAFVKFWAEAVEAIKEYDKKAGNPEFYYLTEEEHARWAETIWPVNELWVEENEARGYPAGAILEDAVAFAAQYK